MAQSIPSVSIIPPPPTLFLPPSPGHLSGINFVILLVLAVGICQKTYTFNTYALKRYVWFSLHHSTTPQYFLHLSHHHDQFTCGGEKKSFIYDGQLTSKEIFKLIGKKYY